MCLKYGFENKVYILNQNTHDILFQIVIKDMIEKLSGSITWTPDILP